MLSSPRQFLKYDRSSSTARFELSSRRWSSSTSSIDKGCLERRRPTLVETKFECMDYGEAIKKLEKSVKKKKFEFPAQLGQWICSPNTSATSPRKLVKATASRRSTTQKTIKAFYMRLNDDEKTVAAMDVLAPGIGEIIGGSAARRAPRYVRQKARLKELDLPDRGLLVVPRPSQATAPFPTPDSASASSAPCNMSRGSRTSATSSPSRARPSRPSSNPAIAGSTPRSAPPRRQ